jgi:phenylpyruvate tautomerase PptA (4-oxalocrotonate tautomerase family)
VNQSQNRLLRDVKLCSSHFPPIENKSQYQSCGKMLAASFSTLKLVNQCVIYEVAELVAEVAELVVEVAELVAEVAELVAEVAELVAEVANLRSSCACV